MRRTAPFRATVSPECVTAFNDLKLAKKYKYIIYKLSDNNREIVVEEASEDGEWDNFREKLVNAQTKSKSVRLPLRQLKRSQMRHEDY